MKQKSKLEERYGGANRGFRPRNANKQNPGQEEERNIHPGRRQNWKEENDRSENKDNRMK
ncbi:MAG: hypothetical protein NUV91_05720 [Candidatus Omnitrophica bacterium]|nr:hypothetical protein [Candidatus Omnitrophota bacterium]